MSLTGGILMAQSDQAGGTAASNILGNVSALGRELAQSAKLIAEVRDEEVEIGTAPKEEVWRSDKIVLYRYKAATERKLETPLLIVFSLVGRYTIVDLQEDRSMVRNLLKLGIDIFVIDWGSPSRADRYLTMSDYINDYLDGAVEAVKQASGASQVNLLGICEGGTFSLCYAALHPQNVENLILMVTPVDFHARDGSEPLSHGLINLWTQNLAGEDIDEMMDVHGVMSGELMAYVFTSMNPVRNTLKYNLDLLDVTDDKKKFLNFLRMEKWIADRPHHPGEVAKQWVKDLYQNNCLVVNKLLLDSQRVELPNVTMPVLNIYARDDHIIPTAMTRGLGKYIGTKDYTELELPAGHMGIFVSGKTQSVLAKSLADWLFAHQKS
jgi:poly[(R)-3-hydroxyalkanoate] polymerase subunit PhaC